jgi:hypothetical protein
MRNDSDPLHQGGLWEGRGPGKVAALTLENERNDWSLCRSQGRQLGRLGSCLLLLLGPACSDGPGAGGAKNAGAPDAIESIDHEACEPKGHRAETFDARGDGKAVVIKVFDGQHELCRITDINHDGKPDLYEYFDANGVIRRRESDYDSNGTIDSVELYEDGKLVKREYDTTGQRRVDTWDYFDKGTGKRLRRERDTTNDGKVDQWWTWDGDKITISIDRNGDGKPDPDSTLVLDEKTGEPNTGTKDAKTAPVGSASPAPAGSTAAADAPPLPTAPPLPMAPSAPSASLSVTPPPPAAPQKKKPKP